MREDNEFAIDQGALDREWLRQATLMYDACLELADAKKSLNEAKSARDVVEAEQDRDVRLHPSRHGLEKVTEPQVERAVRLTSAFREADRDVIERQHEHDVLQAAVSALENKKRALENLVHLHQMAYFAEPRTDEAAHDKLREQARDRAFGARKAPTNKSK